MTPINNIDDLVRILDEHPEWVEALRARLLTRALLELPQTVAELAEVVAELRKGQVRLEERQTRLEESQTRLAESMARLETSHAELARSLTGLAEEMARMGTRQNRMQDDLGWLKGRIIYDIVRNDAALIADEMGFRLDQTLARPDLMRLTQNQDLSDLPRGTQQSFHRADLMMAVVNEAGERHYIAVEASFTVNGRDSRRARRNAELMTRLTGLPAMAAVAGVRYDWGLKDEIESQRLHWYEIPTEDLEAE